MPPPSPIRFRRPAILAACMAASFMAAIEATIMATAMPAIATSLDGFALFAWVFSSYMVAQAVTIPLYGRLADLYGRRRPFLAGILLFLLGSLLCGFAHSMLQLVIFRAIQGVGAGGVQPIANTIIGDLYSPVERARVQGMLSGMFGFAAVIGPSFGAFIVRYGDWPLVFWINLPVGVAAIAMILRFLPRHDDTQRRQVDYLGALLLMLVIAALMLLLIRGGQFADSTSIATLACFLLAATLFVLQQRQCADPILPRALWRNRVVISSGLGSLVTGILMMGVTAYLPTYIQGVMGRGAETSAMILALMSIVWVLGSTAAGLYLPRTSYRRVAACGALALMAGGAMLIAMTPGSLPVWLAIAVTLIGAGMGFCNTTFIVSAQTSVAWRQRGAATSSTMFLRFLGQSLGAALFGILLGAGLQDGAGGIDKLLDPQQQADLSASARQALVNAIAACMHHAYLLTGTMAVLALGVAFTYAAKLGPAVQTRRI